MRRDAPPGAGAPRPRARKLAALRLAVGLLLIALIVWRADVGHFVAALSGIDPGWLLVGFIVQTSSVYVWALRWARLLWIFDMPLPLTRLLKALFVGGFFSSFLPTSFGGDVYRGYWALDDKGQFRKSVFIVFVERFIGLVTLAYLILPVVVVLLTHGLALDGAFLPAAVLIGLLCASVLALNPAVFGFFNRLLFGERPWLAGVRTKITAALTVLHDAGRKLVAVYFYSFVIQVQGIVFFYCLGRALGLPLDLWQYAVIVPPTVLATMFLPISFNGLGVREAMLVLMTSILDVGVKPAEAVALGVLVLSLNLIGALLGGAFYVLGDSQAAPSPPAA